MNDVTLLLGQTLDFSGAPSFADPTGTARHDSAGAVAIKEGVIVGTGSRDDMIAQYATANVIDYADRVILPGFVDAHAHYPQTAMIASWGKRLIDWLNGYTFPEEMRFDDRDYATEIADRYLDLILSNGTTSVASYCTSHPESVDAFFGAAATRGMRVYAGKTCMDRNAPEALCDTAKRAYDESKALLDRWHGRERASYVITPRFSPTSTADQLEALGALWAEHPDCLMQTHLSEQTDEIAWVKELFPEARDYLETYEAFGLLREGGLYGHAIHLEARERDRLSELGAGLVHCPTSNTFIGSGLFDMGGLWTSGARIALATDTGGGSSFSMLRTMAAAYEVAQLNHVALHPAQLLWLATAGSAHALHAAHQIGDLSAGSEADIVVLDLASTPAIAQRSERAEDIWQALFPTIMMGDDRAIADVWVGGTRMARPMAQSAKA